MNDSSSAHASSLNLETQPPAPRPWLTLDDIRPACDDADDVSSPLHADLQLLLRELQSVTGAEAAAIVARGAPEAHARVFSTPALSLTPEDTRRLFKLPTHRPTQFEPESGDLLQVHLLDTDGDQLQARVCLAGPLDLTGKVDLAVALGRAMAGLIKTATVAAKKADRLASSALADMLATIVEPGPLDQLLGKLAAQVGAATNSMSVAIDTYDTSGTLLNRNLFIDPRVEDYERLAIRWRALAESRRQTPSTRRNTILNWHTPIVIPDLIANPLAAGSTKEESDFYAEAKLRTIAVFPLWMRDEFVGILSIADNVLRTYTREELEGIQRVAAIVATAIKGVQMFHDLAEVGTRDRSAYLENIERLAAAAELRDTYTGVHLHHMEEITRRLGTKLELRPALIEDIARASCLHDIGKISIPDAILLKPGPLTIDEREVMKQHTLTGEKLLTGSFFNIAREVARHHHERWDGRGYPDGLTGADIPLAARMVAVADVYDALTSERPYKGPWEPEAAYEEIVGLAGQHFDPQIVDAFRGLWDSHDLPNLQERRLTGAA